VRTSVAAAQDANAEETGRGGGSAPKEEEKSSSTKKKSASAEVRCEGRGEGADKGERTPRASAAIMHTHSSVSASVL
jgi:hypothetical protein